MILIIDSRDRFNTNQTTTNFDIKLQNPIKNVQSIRLKEIHIDFHVYNVNTNNYLYYYEGATSKNVHIISGIYQNDELCDALTTALNDNSSYEYNVSHDSITGFFTISCTTDFKLSYQNNSLMDIMGFKNKTYSLDTSITGDYCSKVEQQEYYFIDVSILSPNIQNTMQITRGDFYFCMNKSGYQKIEFNELSLQCIKLERSVDFNNFTIQIMNKNGEQINNHGGNIIYIFELL